MNRLRSYHILGLIALILLISSPFLRSKTFDLHLSDTYYIVAISQIYMSMAIVLIVSWCLYYMYGASSYSRAARNVHIVLTALTALLIALIPLLTNTQVKYTSVYLEVNSIIAVLMIVFLITPFILILNIAMGLFKNKNR
ncbi:MAG TPA: hypothetical protein VM012_01355 [Flavitalea sp.]|nr:hypothetical protein [Flavitalea sp.]